MQNSKPEIFLQPLSSPSPFLEPQQLMKPFTTTILLLGYFAATLVHAHYGDPYDNGCSTGEREITIGGPSIILMTVACP